MKNIQQIMVKLGFSVKREMTRAIIINALLFVAAVGVFIITKKVIYLGSCVAGLILFNFFYFSRYGRKDKEEQENTKSDFVSLFTFFRIYLHNGYSVYSSLKEIIPFANERLAGYLNELIRDIDEDKTVEPFVRFGRKFNDLVIEEMMISVYQMVDDGSDSSYLHQFELIFNKVADVAYEKELTKKQNSLGSMTAIPLIGSAIVIIMITFGVIQVMGDMINVI